LAKELSAPTVGELTEKEKTMFEKITIFAAKKIITMTESMPTAEAVAVADGKIVSVGTPAPEAGR